MKYSNFTIKKLSLSPSSIDIEWNDRKKSYFHFLWLRDNCPSNEHPDARHRMFNLLDVSEDIYPTKYFLNNFGNLEIEWSEGNHHSCYNAQWLRNHCYTIKNNETYQSPYKLWQSSLANNLKDLTIEYNEVMKDDAGLIKWLDQLHLYGFSLIKNSPVKNKSAYKIINKISHIRETFFKTPFEVINIPKPNNTAYTAKGLRNHTDLPYYEYAPGYQFLHCLVNDAEGGDSSVVDGFAVAEYVKKNNPEIFEILVNTPVKFKDNDYTQNTIRTHHAPLITLTKDMDFNDIRFSIATMAALDLHPKKMKEFYSAYRKFASLVHDKKFSVHFKLQAGDIFGFNNRRVLHGRTEFDPNSGHRHLEGYYLDRDELLSRMNFLKKIEI
ncbi:TauD/TfdA family dioxygenase [Alphaproteobacteria bacterium]|nr:TauD/TfdA family dioxygenase [Alphaproteobacteria bacterium]